MYVLMLKENCLLSGTSRSILDYILIDRSDQDLIIEKTVSKEKGSFLYLSFEELRG